MADLETITKSRENQIKSNQALSYVWFAWSLQGVYQIKTYKFYHTLHAAFTIIVANIIYASGFVIELFFLESTKQLLTNLPMNVCVVACGIKFVILLRMRKQLVQVGELIDELDSRPFSLGQKAKIENAVKFCHRLAIFTIICYFTVNTVPFISAITSNRNRLVFELWLPYDWKQSKIVFYGTIIGQYAVQTFLATQNVANDISGPTYLSVIDAHLRVIMDRIESLHWNPKKSDSQTRKDFVQCVKDHKIVFRIFDILQGTVSHIIFIQFAATVLVMLASAWTYLFIPLKFSEQLGIFIFMIAEIIQIYPCCYVSDKFMETTDKIVFSLYSSNWMDMSTDMRKLIIIFMQMTQKSKVVVAGKIIPITLTTFVSVMKITYSLVTVVNQV